MCGRFTLTADPELIQQTFNLDTIPASMTPRYNVAPSQPVAVITNENPRELTFHRWGLIPSWSKDPKIGNRMINARSETADEKPSFRAAFKRRRCLIPADGFYEWMSRKDGKAPMYIHLQDRELFAFAGLWEIWHSPQGDEMRTCTILTGDANEFIRPLHHRMPIILDRVDYDLWLSPDEMPSEALKPLMRSYDPERMAFYEVAKTVNSPANDTPACIEPFAPPEQQTLFR
jgi:putative SOS response-associated peptidase YedK